MSAMAAAVEEEDFASPNFWKPIGQYTEVDDLKNKTTGGLLAEAHAANQAFAQITTSLASSVSDLQALSLLCVHDGHDTDVAEDDGAEDSGAINLAVRNMTRSIASQLASAEEKIAEFDKVIGDEIDATKEALQHMHRLREVDFQAGKLINILKENGIVESGDDDPELLSGDDSGSENGADEKDEFVINTDSISNPRQEEHHGEKGTINVLDPSFEIAVMKNELDQVPKYMRGRLTFEKCMRICSFIKQTFVDKYTKLGLPRAKLSAAVRDKLLLWQDQEVQESALTFITIDDIMFERNNCSQPVLWKDIDVNAVKCTLQVLRFHKKLNLLSSGGFVRYCIPKKL